MSVFELAILIEAEANQRMGVNQSCVRVSVHGCAVICVKGAREGQVIEHAKTLQGLLHRLQQYH